jgi:hypothetical protein
MLTPLGMNGIGQNDFHVKIVNKSENSLLRIERSEKRCIIEPSK